MKDDGFETQIYETFASIIARKIYLEYGLHSNYPRPSPIFEGSAAFKIILEGQSHSVNKDTDFCDCLRINYLGLPCRHLFRLWTSLGFDIWKRTINSCNERWISNFPVNYESIRKSRSQSSTTQNLINLDLACSKNSKQKSGVVEHQGTDSQIYRKEVIGIQITGESKDLSKLKLATNVKIKNVSQNTNSKKKDNPTTANSKRKLDLIITSPSPNKSQLNTFSDPIPINEQPIEKKVKRTTSIKHDPKMKVKKSISKNNDDEKLFSLITLNDNSCRFDTFLILMTFLTNSCESFAEILPGNVTLDPLIVPISFVNNGENDEAQTLFRSRLEKIKYGSTYLGAQGLQEIHPLFKYFLKGPRFEFIFHETRVCTRPKSDGRCPYTAVDSPEIFQPPIVIDTMTNEASSQSKYFLQRFLDATLAGLISLNGCRCNTDYKLKTMSIITP